MLSGSKRKSKPRLIVALRIARGVELKTSSLDFSQLPDPMQGVIPCTLIILAIPNARLKTFFLTRSVEISFTHGTSKVRRKPGMNQSFHIVSYLYGLLFYDCQYHSFFGIISPLIEKIKPPHHRVPHKVMVDEAGTGTC
jgi:hypothetical protein